MYNDVTTRTMKRQEYKEPDIILEMVRYIKENKNSDKNHLIDKRIFKHTNGNITKND